MVYRGPLLYIIWLLPHLLSCQQVLSLPVFCWSCLLTGEEGRGWDRNHLNQIIKSYDGDKAWSSMNYQSILVGEIIAVLYISYMKFF